MNRQDADALQSSPPPEFAADGAHAAPVFPTLEEIAQLLPQYEFHDVLGVGGMGAVYLARQPALDRWVAIKLLPQSASQNPEDAARFIAEARSMARLTHAHIVAVYDFGQTTQGHLYLVMEHVNGLDLHRLIHRGTVTPERIRSLVPQLCDALQYAHNHGIVHRDIKPANILLTEDWQAKIVDFGLAHEHGASTAGELEYGTPDYVAPERLQPDAVVDHRADIYSLGVVIHEMFTKQTPQAAGDAAMAGVPAAYASVIQRCMQADPARRFQKASEVKAFLASAPAASMHPQAAAAPSLPSDSAPYHPNVPRLPAESYRQGRGLGQWGWAAALVLLLGGGAWLILRQDKAAPEAVAAAATKPTEPAPSAAENEPPPAAAPQAVPSPDARPSVAEAGTPAPPAPAAAPMVPPPAIPASASTPAPAAPSDSAPQRMLGLAQMTPFHPEPEGANVIKRLAGHAGLAGQVLIHPNQALAITGGTDYTVRFWNLSTGELLRTLVMPAGFYSPTSIRLNPAGTRLAVISIASCQAHVYDLESGRLLSSATSPEKSLTSCRWSPDGKGLYLLHPRQDGGVYYWEPDGQQPPAKLEEWPRAAHDIAFSPATDEMYVIGDNRTLAPGSNRYTIGASEAAVFSLSQRRLKRSLPMPWDNGSGTLVVSAGGGMLARTFAFVSLHQFPSLQTTGVFPAPGSGAGYQGTVIAEDESFVLSAVSTGLIHGCETKVGGRWFSMETGRRSGSQSLALSKDGRWAVFGGYSIHSREGRPEDHEVLVLRIPELSAWNTGPGGLLSPSQGPGTAGFGSSSVSNPAIQARAQLKDLDRHDPELAALQQQIHATHPVLDDRAVGGQVRDLVAKYGAALRREAVRASPKDQLAMTAEAAAIEAGSPVPDASTDAATSGDLKRLRGIYRAQLADFDKRRTDAGAAALKAMGVVLKAFAEKRRQAGDTLGAARADAMMALLASPKTVESLTGQEAKAPAMAAVAASGGARPPNSTTAPAGAPPGLAPSPAAPAPRLQRPGKPGRLIKVERVTKSDYSGSASSLRVGSIPPDLGPVLQVACSRHHAVALLPDGSLRSWGTWGDGSTTHVISPDATDVVAVETEDDVTAVILANGSVASWSASGTGRAFIWRPGANVTVTGLRKGDYYHLYAICSDGSLRLASPYGGVDKAMPPSPATDVTDIAGDELCGWFAVKKDGSLLHWGADNIHIGNNHALVKDAVSISEGNEFVAVLHKDGTVDGWGDVYERQRLRVRKYPGALRLLDDPAARIFVVQKPGNEWSVLNNPACAEYREEERLGVLEGKLKGCTSVALSESYVLAVKPE